MQKVFLSAFACLLVCVSGYAAAESAASNYNAASVALSNDARQGNNKFAQLSAGLHAAVLNKGSFKTNGLRSSFDDKLGTSTFLWAPNTTQASGNDKFLAFSPLRPELRTETIAREVLGNQASFLRLDRAGIKDAKLFETHDTGRGPIIARFKQYKDGLEVFGRSLNVMLDRNLNAVATSGYFAPAEIASGKAALRAGSNSSATLDAESALASAFSDMGGSATRSSFAALRSAGDYTVYSARRSDDDYHIVGTPQAKKIYYYLDGHYIPAWYAGVHAQTIDAATDDDYGYVISAVDGKVLFRKNLTSDDAYSYRVFADATTPFRPNDEPINANTLDPYTGGVNGNQGRTQNTANLVNLVNSGLIVNAAAKLDPWLPPGATVTTGNNVDAYMNLAGGDGFDAGDIRGAISSASTFDYPYTVDADPATASQRQAAITNQFFVNNWLHDFWYDHGFNEAAGNAQSSNFGRGGAEGDPIMAQGQDNSGRNNANMSTPPDGGSPTQRMFLFDGPQLPSSMLTITQPAGIGSLAFGTASFGPRNFDLTADVVQIADAANATNGCQPAANAAALAGKIALIDRGVCSFKTKTRTAQNAGAAGVILANNRAGGPPGLGGDSTITTVITIPTLSVSQADGNTIKAALAGTVTAHMLLQFAPDRDGTMDIQIMAHEFFHYVSNRLVGDALGLDNSQGGGMGEGWSDFNAMLLTVRPEDALVAGNDKYQGAYPLSAYVEDNQYFGIRRYPYSTNLNVDPLSFKHISNGVALPTTAPIAPGFGLVGADNAEVHNTGEVWCTALWEVYASLLNDPRHTALQARSRMQDYIIAGLKMTPVSPNMLEARDALLAAARATDAGDFTLMAKAFAKRGMGVGAVAPSRADSTNAGALESSIAIAAGVEVTDATLTFTGLPGTVVGDADSDSVLDIGETGRLNFTVVNHGTADMSQTLTGTLAPVPGVSYSNGGALVVPKLLVGQSAVISVLVTLNSATQAQALALVLQFPAANDPRTGSVGPGGISAQGGEFDTVVNYDEMPFATTDDVEDTLANLHDWKRDNGGTAGPGWLTISGADLFGADVFGSGQFWFGPDNDHPSDISLISPPISVGTANDFTLAFDHFYAFEFAGFGGGNAYGYDGGVIEVSQDGGATWVDAFDPAIGASVITGTGYTGFILSLLPDGTFDPTDSGSGHPGFVDANEDPNNPSLEHVRISFAKTLAGKTVRIRFRETSDPASGVIGWVVDNIALTGAINKPFSKTVADAGAGNKIPVANAGPDQEAVTRSTVQLNGGGSSDPYNTALSYQWLQTAGPAVTLDHATSKTPSFDVGDNVGTFSFSLTVTDAIGRSSAPDSVTVVTTKAPHQGGAMGAELLLLGLAASALRRRRRKH
jgi:hypothetical protein